jgi:hypothetical protein
MGCQPDVRAAAGFTPTATPSRKVGCTGQGPQKKPRLVERGLSAVSDLPHEGLDYRQQARLLNAEPRGWLMIADETRTL